ncbi:site-specific recombinase [Leeia sp. TBRC 13508]|uniref:Site-specific recombinase n=1 Tax=Leeia speluncae TaxID=2884804 RepID=A0ABS8D6F8_9NEIS|nr:site-specific recombinase [Leeia speluncae]MCB6183213.1 site-specific recombinase [Leeia speluncae]
MELLLNKLLLRPDACDERWLMQLINCIRPNKKQEISDANLNMIALVDLLERRPEYQLALSSFVKKMLLTYRWQQLFSDSGIPDSKGFAAAFWERLVFHFLPPIIRSESMIDQLGIFFSDEEDEEWLSAISPSIWRRLFSLLVPNAETKAEITNYLRSEIVSAIQVLSYRVSAIGLEPELIRNVADLEKYDSPFIQQNVEVVSFLNKFKHLDASLDEGLRGDQLHIEVLLSQCESIIGKVRKNAQINGVSISLTRLLLKLGLSISRLKELLALLEGASPAQVGDFALAVVRNEAKRYSIKELFGSNTALLSLQVTEHAGRTGEHYAANNRAEWKSMLKSAMGAGFVIAWMALLKILISKMDLSPLGFAVLYSLNYGLGFMLIHILHFTVATKQPAMTANMIAANMDSHSKSKKQRLDGLVDLCTKVARTQWIAIAGNILFALPLAILIAMATQSLFGHPLANAEKAKHLLADLDPIHSLALFHAAIAGVCLFLSGLISGYYDNKASYNHIPERLKALPGLQSILGRRRLNKMADYIGQNLGALTGNFFFGCMLGTIGVIGLFIGLPIDIRHIAFSSANWGFAMASMDWQVTWHYALLTFAGFLLVGMVNLFVSFSIALSVAMRSRRVALSEDRQLIKALLAAFKSKPSSFFIPPKEEAASASMQKDSS